MHYCAFCGWRAPADSATILEPDCASCGCTLRSETAAEFDRGAHRQERRRGIGSGQSADTTGFLAFTVVLALALPAAGIGLGDVVFAVPLAALALATAYGQRAARLPGDRQPLWAWLTVATGLATCACVVGIVGALAGTGSTLALYLAALSSVAVFGGACAFAVPCLLRARLSPLTDAVIIGIAGCAVAAVFVVVPGFREGDPVLTAVAMVDVVALLLATLGTVARRVPSDRQVMFPLLFACLAVTVDDTLVSASAAGQVHVSDGLIALLWSVAGYVFSVAARAEPGAAGEVAATAPAVRRRRPYARTLLPLALVLGLEALGAAMLAAGDLQTWEGVTFGAVLAVQVVLAFGRQALLLADNNRIVDLERTAREVAQSRNEELEALTGLATTMTQTLEEAPIAEQALSVLHLAARATSSALHVRDEQGTYTLRATAGDWQTDKTWPGTPADASPREVIRGGRAIVRLALEARAGRIGTVTLVRRAGDPFAERELELLCLLVDQMAVAIQNARDYREKLEQATRDPLTGLHNRRFLFDALDKEVARSARYGNDVSLVIFDVDAFKSINDDHGHAAGDEVLRVIGRATEAVLRPTDSFARIGGEEFALLLPETAQLDALLIAERLRTAISRRSILDDRRVTVSGGVASCPSDATTRADLHRRADAALYWAKRNGRDLCAVASEVADKAQSSSGEREGMLVHLHALVASIDAQHLHTRDHSDNVAAYAVALGQALELDPEHVVRLRRAALLHDIGKVAIPRAVLEKPSRLTDAEFEQIKLHAPTGASMLAHAGLREEASWVRHHHERLDGGGYPDGIAGDDIPLEARIIFVADSFEAMTSDRPYRAGMPVADAVAELRRCAGTQFQADIVETFARIVDDGSLAVLSLRRDQVGPRTAS